MSETDLDDYDESLVDESLTAEDDFDADLRDDTVALWDDDKGTLEMRQRDTLVALLKKSFISSDDKQAWRTLIQDPDPIVRNLNNLYFNLVLDEVAEVAYATPARSSDHPFKTLVHDSANSREETLLLIYLRERHRAETAAGQPVVYADAAAMLEYVARFRPATATDLLGDQNRVVRAIEGLVKSGILVKTSDKDRYRLHRAIEALLPLDTLNQLLEAFRRHNAGADQGESGAVTGDDGELADDRDDEGDVA